MYKKWKMRPGKAFLAYLIMAIVLTCAGCAEEKLNTELIGVWQYDAYTQYQFTDASHGCMCLDKQTHYEYSYRIEENILYIDFTLDYVTDCQYTYTLAGDQLTLVGGPGTAEVGKEYVLARVAQ